MELYECTITITSHFQDNDNYPDTSEELVRLLEDAPLLPGRRRRISGDEFLVPKYALRDEHETPIEQLEENPSV